jgi:trimeric autotransporter adhesin
MKKILLFCSLFISSLAFSQVTFLTTDTTWSGDVVMNGKVVVNANVTLTIEPGTVIKATFKADPVDASALIVAKDGNIIANGTAALPIIFTSEYDALTAANVASGTYVATNHDLTLKGLWGGLIILGKNVIGAGPNNTANIEGIAAGQSWTNYGGTATDDSSGSLKYISIRHGGATIADGSEINGLTMGGVGNKTIVENIEIISNDDDGIEIFGGNVNVNNLLVYNCTDDAVDLDQAYSGTITNSLVAMGVGGDNVFEIDGTESTSNPVVTGSYTIDRLTAIGNANAGQLDTFGDWKANATGANKNIVYKGFKTSSRFEFIQAETYNNNTLTRWV